MNEQTALALLALVGVIAIVTLVYAIVRVGTRAIDRRPMRIDRSSVPEMGDQEVAEYEAILNAVFQTGEAHIGERQPDGSLRIHPQEDRDG